MKKTISVLLILFFQCGCATNNPVANRKQVEVVTSTPYVDNLTAWEECCWNDIGPVIIRTPRQRIRVNIWFNTRWGNRGW